MHCINFYVYIRLCNSRYGSTMIKLDVDVKNGGLKLDEQFLVDFGEEKNDILLAHEMRFVSYCTRVSYVFPNNK